MNEKTIHTGRNVRKSGLAVKQHSSTVCAAYGGMIGSMKRIYPACLRCDITNMVIESVRKGGSQNEYK